MIYAVACDLLKYLQMRYRLSVRIAGNEVLSRS